MAEVLREQAQAELLTLRDEQNKLLEAISDSVSSLGTKILRLAQILERRIDLGDRDCFYPVNQISTIITRMLHKDNPDIAYSTISRALPEKYKDPRLSQYGKLTNHIESMVVKGGLQLTSQQIEQSSNDQLNFWDTITEEFDNTLDTTVMHNNQIRAKLEEEANKRGIQLNGRSFRDPIGIDDIPGEHIETLEGLNKASGKLLKEISNKISQIAERFLERPPTTFEHAKHCHMSFSTFDAILRPNVDDKWTGDIIHWMRRGYIEEMQGKHGAGNSDKFPTMLCSWCSRDVDEDPNDYERMYRDETSLTGYRCLNCNGTTFIERETTREQIGDRKDWLFTTAHNIAYSDPFIEAIHFWNENYVMPYENSRKVRIGPQFSKAAIGGTEKKVIKAKTK